MEVRLHVDLERLGTLEDQVADPERFPWCEVKTEHQRCAHRAMWVVESTPCCENHLSGWLYSNFLDKYNKNIN